jgi:sulfoacetaldehyde dehydrogenase
MVKAAYSSGKPAYGVGAGNATMVIDETADAVEAARNSAISKTNDHGSGCSADGNLVIDHTIYDAMLAQLQKEGGYLVNAHEKEQLRRAYWDEEGRRTADTIARPAPAIAAKAGINLPAGKTFFIVPEDHIGRQHPYSTESSASSSRCSKPTTSPTRSTRCGRFSKRAAAAIRAASTRSTMSISIASRSWRR